MAELFYAIFGLYLSGGILSLIFSRRQNVANALTGIFAVAASFAGILFALSVFANHATLDIPLITLFDFLPLHITVDTLGAFFILLISVISLAASVFAHDYVKPLMKEYNIGVLGFLYHTFVASMILVVSSGSAPLFLLAWELMSILSYFLVIYEYRRKDSLRAGLLYIVMTQISTVFLSAAFFLLYQATGSFQFADYHVLDGIPSVIKNAIFLLMFVGCGIKAGVVPFHIWLPVAHPAAPSHVSALMSGVMIKVALYGMARFMFDFLGGEGQSWWGVVVLAVGALSAILGVLYALMEHDLKRLLAYHSVENIGIILIGFGSALLFDSYGFHDLVAIGLVAGLFHVFNHGLFKSLLFLGVGAIQRATGVINIEELGGLVKKMPATAVLFLIGAMSISALPPFNGFISEWLTFQSLFANFAISSLVVKMVLALSVALFALTSALAISCFAKVFGIGFLALPRSDHARKAEEVSPLMLWAKSFLAILCVLFGVFPFLMFWFLGPVVKDLGLSFGSQVTAFSIIPNPATPTGLAPLAVAALLAAVMLGISFVLALRFGRHRKRESETWACGRLIDSRTEYTATSFTMPFELIFSSLYRPSKNIERETLGGSKYLVQQISYQEKIEPLFERYFYDPVKRLILNCGMWARNIQAGNINLYLAYIFVTLLGLLLFFR
ncbi:MAG TPA: hydrogenase 4 subunit B [Patescibacteria group bacterium]|nr:hydrogenase 4 subunit B [Patescibacteria group bacterium]